MSDASDDEDFAFYGTPLDPIEEDAIPSKKPTPIEDQVVKDKYGRRRFHGAFTGGFSAGYCNSVGSEEGWTPSSFKSSRAEKASQQFQKPEDFMDEEDQGEFGIAPKVLRATSDYNQSSSRKRAHSNYSTGPIPGQPVLRDILLPVKDTVGVRLLRNMGWRPGQGVGPRLNRRQKKIQQKEIKQASKKVYGCQLPGSSTHSGGSGGDSSDESDSEMQSMTFAPDDYDAFVVKIKDDVFGIGYQGLDKRPVLSGHVQLFEPSFLGMQEKKKKVAIWGQAFGVGALEEDDADIYARDDMAQYDFALDTSSEIAQRKKDARATEHQKRLALGAPRLAGAHIEGFVLGKKQPSSQRKFFRPPDLPPGFKAVHETKQSRWDVNSKGENVAKKQGLGRHDLDSRVRASILDEPLPKPPVPPPTPSSVSTAPSPVPQVAFPSFSAASADILPLAVGGSTFQPFASQPDKQARYEKFLEFSRSAQKDLLSSIQPPSMTEWDKDHERSEFEQAARLYKPLSGIMGDRFVSATQPDDSLNPLASVEKMKHGNEEMRNAAKMKLFGKLTRIKSCWQPCALLCKRFNVPQPTGIPDVLESNKRPTNYSVFDFLEASSHNTISAPPEHVIQEKIQASNSSTEGEIKEKIQASNSATELRTKEITPVRVEVIQDPPAQFPGEKQVTEGTIVKKLPSISDTLARLLADETGQIQPEPEEKPDLFKAIFLSSSEDSASDSEDENSTSKVEGATGKVVTEEMIAPRNLSPPRGIFANLDLDALNTRSVKKSESPKGKGEDSHKNEDQQDEELLYGPRLPSALPKLNIPSSSNIVPQQNENASASAVWVERTVKIEKASGHYTSDSDDSSASSSTEKRKSSKKKKHKKEKKIKKEKKHKKHKSKSKHKKKS